MNITVAIPSIAPRKERLKRAVQSVLDQTLPAAGISISLDTEKQGAAFNRQRALDGVPPSSGWVAFLDDDDYFYPEHLQVLAECAEETGADYVFSYYVVHDRYDTPRPEIDPLQHFGRVFDPLSPHQTTITTLVRTGLAKSVGFHNPPEHEMIHGQVLGEDFKFTTDCIAAGAKIVHVERKTWAWVHHESNTSGKPSRWEL